MACIDVDDLMFECPICIENIDNTCKVLPCQHTFCLQCLQKLYDVNPNPQCPTCRIQVNVSINELQRPILLLNLFEKVKTGREQAKKEEEGDLTSAIEQSINDYDKDQEVKISLADRENMQLEIALAKSQDQALFEAEKESLLHAQDEIFIAVINLSLHEHKQEELDLQTALLRSEREALIEAERKLQYEVAMMKSCSLGSDDETDPNSSSTDSLIEYSTSLVTKPESYTNSENLCRPTSSLYPKVSGEYIVSGTCESASLPADENLITSTTNPKPVSDVNEAVALSITDKSNDKTDICINLPSIQVRGLVNDTITCAFDPSKLKVPDLSFYLKVKHRKPVFDTILIETMDEKKLNILEATQVSWYLEIVDDYLNALTYYRRDQIGETIRDYARNDEELARILMLESWNNNRYRDDCTKVALESSLRTYIEQNEEMLFELELKKSEILDPLDTLHSQLLEVKEKLQFRMAVVVSKQSVRS